MMLDQFTLSLVTALVVVVSAVLYLFETLVRRDGLSGRLWAAAFLAGVFTVLSYLVWALEPGAYVAIGVGNAAFVASAGFTWLGCRAFNRRPLRVAGILMSLLIVVAGVSVLVAGPGGGDWAGAIPLFVGTGICALLGAIETRRGAMGRRWSSVGLTIVLGFEALWLAGRSVVFAVAGPDSDIFVTWFNTQLSSLLTVTFTIVTVVTTSVLRASESNLRGQRDVYNLSISLDGVMLSESFESAVSTMLQRAERSRDTVCVVAMRIDDLRRMATAFGPDEAEQVAAAWRGGVRRYAPTASMVGESASDTLFIAFVTTSFADVRRMASIMHRRLLDDFTALGVSVMPVVGVGIALTDALGYDFRTLAEAADAAAERSATSSDASVIVAG
ncbi:diguanylate cyclase domain-containing protein [Microbacterium sp. P05]|uniref:diguanylate cyclase domain-containing protein n=1 Tax=Microbacterium sp. P05 TaxID=3366948 RepID=UPI00374536E2